MCMVYISIFNSLKGVNEMTEYKLRSKKKPIITATGKVKRLGATYYEVNYTRGGYWTYKEFATRKQATEFIGGL